MRSGFRGVGWGMAAAVLLACVSTSLAVAQQNPPPINAPGVRLPGQRGRAVAPPEAAGRQPTGAAGAPTSPAPGGASSASTATASPTSKPLALVPGAPGKMVQQMEFFNLEIDHLLKFLSTAAEITIVKDPEVTGPITVIAPGPFPLEVAFQILDSILQVRGFTMVRSATRVYKVIPIAKALQSELPVEFGNRPEDVPTTDQYITQVIPLTSLDAGDMASQVQAIFASASIVPTSVNSLVITDTAANIQRALTLIAEWESQLSGGFQRIPLQHYPAEEMADLVNALVLGGGAAGVAPGAVRRPPYERRVVPARPTPAPAQPRPVTAVMAAAGPEFCYAETRTNSLIVLATPAHLQRIQQLVEQLDRPVSLLNSYFFYPVQNLSASELAQRIGPLIGATVTAAPAAGAERGVAAGAAARAGGIRPGVGQFGFPGTQFRGGIGGLPGYTGVIGGGFRTGEAPQETRDRLARSGGVEVEPLAGASAPRDAGNQLEMAQAPEVAIPVAPQQVVPPAEGPLPAGLPVEALPVPTAGTKQATITADDNTNTLLISGTAEQIELSRQLLDWLDVLPPQVQIQAIIAEISLTRDTSLGFQWESLGRVLGTFQGQPFVGDVGTNFGLGAGEDSGDTTTRPMGFFGQISGPEFNAVLSALTSDSHARILSTPSIFTSNNQRGAITVATKRPLPTGTITTTTGTGAAVATGMEYEFVGITLSVTPRITQNNTVEMDIAVSANEPGPSVTVAGQEFPSSLARETEANIKVKDGYTVILGGLMRDTLKRTATRVPLLGDLPIVGSLFRSTVSRREKSELVVFLTPRVVRTEGEAAALTEATKGKMLEVPRSLKAPADGSGAGTGK